VESRTGVLVRDVLIDTRSIRIYTVLTILYRLLPSYIRPADISMFRVNLYY